MGEELWTPAGSPAKGWQFGRIQPRARQLARRERGKRVSWLAEVLHIKLLLRFGLKLKHILQIFSKTMMLSW